MGKSNRRVCPLSRLKLRAKSPQNIQTTAMTLAGTLTLVFDLHLLKQNLSSVHAYTVYTMANRKLKTRATTLLPTLRQAVPALSTCSIGNMPTGAEVVPSGQSTQES